MNKNNDFEKKKNLREETRKNKERPIVLITVISFLVCMSVLVGVCAYIFRPAVDDVPSFLETNETQGATDGSAVTGAPVKEPDEYKRKKGFYTFLVCGVDKVSHHTDVMMLVSIDTNGGEVNILQIPRDTFLNRDNASYRVTRVNGIYTAAYNLSPYTGVKREKGAMEKLCESLESSLCIEIDRYVLMDTVAFADIIDAVGGVDYEIPFDMDYEDPEQDLYIHLKKGMQHLDGKMAEQFIRYRSGYATGDIGRVEARGDFLLALYTQVREKLTLSASVEIAKKLIGSVTTDATIDDIAFFAGAVYGISSENINIKTLAGSSVQNPLTGVWTYYALNKKNALADINRYMNVFGKDITLDLFDKNAIFTDDPDGENPYISQYYYS